MNWKEALKVFEQNKDWKAAVDFLQKIIKENQQDAEAYIGVIYLLHNILVEEEYSVDEQELLSKLLKTYFNESYQKFSNNSEYLFFLGKILYISEWYFGLDDDLKPIEERLAFQLQKKAFEKEPNNKLFEWAYRFSLGDKSAEGLSQKILNDKDKVDWLNSKGIQGKYILESLGAK